MRLKRDGSYHNINCPEVTIGELASPSSCSSKASLQIMNGITSPKAGDKKIKVRSSSPSPSIWLKRRLKTKNLTPILGTKGCNSYRSLSSEDTMKIDNDVLVQEVSAGVNGRIRGHNIENNNEGTKSAVLEDDNHDDVRSKTSGRCNRSVSNNRRHNDIAVVLEVDSRDDTQSKSSAKGGRSVSKNERRLDESRLKKQIEKYRDNWRESEIKKRGNEHSHDRNNECRIQQFVARLNENRASDNASIKGTNSVKSHEECKLRVPEAGGQFVSSPLAYSQQPITKYFMQQDSQTPKSKAKTTRMSKPCNDSSCLIPHLIGHQMMESTKTSCIGNEAKIPETDELAKRKMLYENFRNHRKTISTPEDGLQKDVLRTSSSKSIDRTLTSVATNSTYPLTISESDCNSLMYKTTEVSSLTGLSGSSSCEQPPVILRVVKKGIPLGLASEPRRAASVREGTVVSALTEQSRGDTRRLQKMLEKVTLDAEERERAPLSRKWWEDESQHPSLMSPRATPRKKDTDIDFSFDEFIDSVSDMMGNICTSEFQLCSDEFDDLIGDEIGVRKPMR